MRNPHQELILAALMQYKGDDLQRARAAFRNGSPAFMSEEHGQSGMTRAELLASYEDRDARVDAAIGWVLGIEP